MAEAFTQKNRAMAVTTPLPLDILLLTGFTGDEGISRLFNFQLNVVAETKTKVAFEELLGKPITIRLNEAGSGKRFFNGICNRVGQGDSDSVFTSYTMDMVPKFWLLSRRAQSRIFQRLSVPDILKTVLAGLDVSFELKGTFEPRDYCVQYRETDYNFACRLMEEEGIFYFFKHTESGHTMVLANTPQSHPDLPGGGKVVFSRGMADLAKEAGRVTSWFKRQEIRSGVFTLRDHSFELPHQPLEGSKKIRSNSVNVGQVPHVLTAGPNAQLELYDWPGEYAQRFDGVSAGGGEQPAEVTKIFTDKDRTAAIRMEQETVPALLIQGSGDSGRFMAGHKFTLGMVPGDETAKFLRADGAYVLVSVSHAGSQGDFRSSNAAIVYQNNFTAIPADLPFRPQRDTPKPFVQGLQTAVVVGPAGEEIFTDKFGRVKVHFHWDRAGKSDANDSCWVRVAQVWAGKRWGASFWPRIGQEVVVAFEEGDPDQPIIVGSVYNAEQMPPYLGDGPDSKHAKDNKVSGIKSNTTLGGAGFNEWRFDDTKGKEEVFIHAERNLDTRVKNDSMERIIHDRHLIVGAEKDGKKAGDQKEKVFQDKHLHVLRDQVEKIDGNLLLMVGHGDAEAGGNVDIVIEKTKKELIEEASHLHIKKSQAILIDESLSQAVGGDLAESVKGKAHFEVKGDHIEKVGGDHTQNVVGKLQQQVGGNHALEAQEIHLKAGMKIIIEAGAQLSLKGPGGFVDIGPSGVTIQGTMVLINSGGAAGSGSGCKVAAPAGPAKAEDAKQAKPVDPLVADDSKSGAKSAPK